MGRGRRTDLLALAALGASLLGFFLWPFLLHAERFPLGPDGPVYLWWTRLAAHEGLGAVGERPGVPALALALGGTLRLSTVAVVSALEVALACAVGLAAAALAARATEEVEGPAAGMATGGPMGLTAAMGPAGPAHGGRAAWLLAGLLSGTFAAHLAAGYLANLAFAAAFTVAAALLAGGGAVAAALAAAVLAGGGLAHPLFLLLGLVILGGAALLALRDGARREAGRLAAAGLGAGVATGLGLLAMLAGPDPIAADTSKDAFLRRAGLAAELRAAYLDRFVRRWARYVQWLSLPLAALGAAGPGGPRGTALPPAPADAGWPGREVRAVRSGGAGRRLLLSWLAATVAGAFFGLATGLLPPDRFVTFGYAVPILAARGLVRARRRLAGGARSTLRRVVAGAVAAALGAAMVLGAALAWRRQEPFLSPAEVAATAGAGLLVARFPDRPLAFVVDDDDRAATFLLARAANVIRAAIPPERIRDVVVFLGTPADYLARRPTLVGAPERDALARLSLADVLRAAKERGREPAAFLLAPFARPDVDEAARLGARVARGVFLLEPPLPAGAPVTTPPPWPSLRPSSPGAIALASGGVLALLAAIGWPWARIGVGRGAGCPPWLALAVAPATGGALLTLAAVLAERLGVPLSGAAGPTAVSAAVGLGGELLRRVVERGAVAGPPA